jgi:hypothetical protein
MREQAKKQEIQHLDFAKIHTIFKPIHTRFMSHLSTKGRVWGRGNPGLWGVGGADGPPPTP